MAKGSGLSIDSSDPFCFFPHKPTVLNSFSEHPFNSPTNCRKLVLMDTSLPTSPSRPSSPSPAIRFPLNLQHPLPPASDEKRVIVDEMNFFADNKLSDSAMDADDKENSDVSRIKLELNVNTGLNLLTTNTNSDQSLVDDGISPNVEDKRAKNELVVLQAELERMNMENQRLRDMLNQVNCNYQALQMHLVTLMQNKKSDQSAEKDVNCKEKVEEINKRSGNGGTLVPRQFMDLGLATDADEPSLSSSEANDRRLGSLGNNGEVASEEGAFEKDKKENSSNQPCQEWGPNKVRRFNSGKDVDQTEATMNKARVSVRARSEQTMITDGCQWRKYGQKMAKGNPCPRAYYRCTMAAGCPVRKQVQRCAEDRTILITTYEGNHSHPLPPAAMAMASTTSSAARMLLTGSMSSADHNLMNPNFLARTLLPSSSSMATISASAPFPTITLDLTQTPTNPLQFQRPPSHLQIPFPSPSPNTPPTLLPQIFGQALYNQSKFSGLQMSQESIGQSGPQSAMADTLSAATAAITADPNFTAALAAAITSIIGGGHSNNVSHNNIKTSEENNSNSSNKISSSSFSGN